VGCGFSVDLDLSTHASDSDQPVLPAFGSDSSSFFSSVRPLTLYLPPLQTKESTSRESLLQRDAGGHDNLQRSLLEENKHAHDNFFSTVKMLIAPLLSTLASLSMLVFSLVLLSSMHHDRTLKKKH
jgi:hypothetical protein